MNAMKTTALLLLLVVAIATSSYGNDNDVDGIVPEEYLVGQGPSALKLQRDNADQSEADSSAKADNDIVPGVELLAHESPEETGVPANAQVQSTRPLLPTRISLQDKFKTIAAQVAERAKPGSSVGTAAESYVAGGTIAPEQVEMIINAFDDADFSHTDGLELTSSDIFRLVENTPEGEATDHLDEKAPQAFEGDMMPADHEQLVLFQSLVQGTAKAGTSAGKLWPEAKVKYCYAQGISGAAKTAMDSAMVHITKAVPCFSFEDVGFASEDKCNQIDAVYIDSKPGSCWSHVGYIKDGVSGTNQKLNLATRGCATIGTAIHEMLHTIGQDHEQSRPDRDKYVTVHLDNVIDGKDNNFQVEDKEDTTQPYDIMSIMHYGVRDFLDHSKISDPSARTITVKERGFDMYRPPAHQGQGDAWKSDYVPGERDGMSQMDAYQLATMYSCQSSTLSMGTCVDEVGADGHMWQDSQGQTCAIYVAHHTPCDKYISSTYCCGCGGGLTPYNWTPPESTCSDTLLPTGEEWHDADGTQYNCAWYAQDANCASHGNSYANAGVTANMACCDCGGGVQSHTQAASSKPSASPTPQPTESPTTDAPTESPTDAPTTNAPTDSPTESPTATRRRRSRRRRRRK